MSHIETFMGWLDLEHPGLETVKACVNEQQFGKAAQALLDYYRTRTNVQYYDGW